jgi:predicted lipoprotein
MAGNARVSVGALVCLATLGCSSQHTSPRSQVLRGLVENSAVPQARAVNDAQTALTAQLGELERAPGVPALQAAQAAWKRAVLAWEAARALRIGPVVETRALLRAMYWPVRIEALEKLHSANQPLDDARIDRLGVDVRGMFALEWLLFGAPHTSLSSASPDAARARALASALSRNVQHYAQLTVQQLGDGDALTASLSHDEQQSLSRLVELIVVTVEALTNERLAPLLPTAPKALRALALRGGVSGISGELLLTQLTATAQLYAGERGAGLSALVKAAAPALDPHLRSVFREAQARLRALGPSLEPAVERDPESVVRAYVALKQLERALKSELSSALGVTLTFQSGDED